jgi:hypothetical protein
VAMWGRPCLTSLPRRVSSSRGEEAEMRDEPKTAITRDDDGQKTRCVSHRSQAKTRQQMNSLTI